MGNSSPRAGAVSITCGAMVSLPPAPRTAGVVPSVAVASAIITERITKRHMRLYISVISPLHEKSQYSGYTFGKYWWNDMSNLKNDYSVYGETKLRGKCKTGGTQTFRRRLSYGLIGV